jgi:hypothetical protein
VIRGPMSDRITIATTVFIAGIMIGAFTAAQRPIKPASWNLGLQYNHAMLGDGTINSPTYNVRLNRRSAYRCRCVDRGGDP